MRKLTHLECTGQTQAVLCSTEKLHLRRHHNTPGMNALTVRPCMSWEARTKSMGPTFYNTKRAWTGWQLSACPSLFHCAIVMAKTHNAFLFFHFNA